MDHQVEAWRKEMLELAKKISAATNQKDYALVLITPIPDPDYQDVAPRLIFEDAIRVAPYGFPQGFNFDVVNGDQEAQDDGTAGSDEEIEALAKDPWKTPGWRALMLEALNLMLKKDAPIEMVNDWFDSDDEKLQHFCIEHSRLVWPMGIGLIEVAMELVDGARGNANIDDEGNLAYYGYR